MPNSIVRKILGGDWLEIQPEPFNEAGSAPPKPIWMRPKFPTATRLVANVVDEEHYPYSLIGNQFPDLKIGG